MMPTQDARSRLPATRRPRPLTRLLPAFAALAWLCAAFATPAAALDPYVQISAGEAHSCGVIAGGAVKCWGANRFGQLGDGATSDTSTPVTVHDITGAIAVTTGRGNTCALLADHTIKCWGRGSDGQLGNGGTADSTTPVSVEGINNATALTSGDAHTCALLDDHTIKCWGYGEYEQTGGATYAVTVPSPVTVQNVHTAIAVAAGGDHTCALLTDHTVDCWGYDQGGRLGSDGPGGGIPAPVDNIDTATAVTAGEYHTCALLINGKITCWGYTGVNDWGHTPTPIDAIDNATALSAAISGHTCALLTDRSIKCWGTGTDGQLGDGAAADSSAPVSVDGIDNATTVAVGASHTCALLADHSVKCWGAGGSGQLGDGAGSGSSRPVLVLDSGGPIDPPAPGAGDKTPPATGDTNDDMAAGDERERTPQTTARPIVPPAPAPDRGPTGGPPAQLRPPAATLPMTGNGLALPCVATAGRLVRCAVSVRHKGILIATGTDRGGTVALRLTQAGRKLLASRHGRALLGADGLDVRVTLTATASTGRKLTSSRDSRLLRRQAPGRATRRRSASRS